MERDSSRKADIYQPLNFEPKEMHLTNQTDLFDQEILLLVLAKGEKFRCWCWDGGETRTCSLGRCSSCNKAELSFVFFIHIQ